MLKPFNIVLCVMVSFSAFTQKQQQNFTLQEAIDFALENNRNAKNATRDVDAAFKQKWETTAAGLPQINANVNYQNALELQQQGIPATIINPDASPTDLAPAAFGAQNTAVATATLSQLLFDGSYLVGLQSAKVFLEISKNAKIKTDLEIRKAVINAYGNVLLSEESLKIYERNIKVVEKNLNDTSKIYENGLAELESVEQLQITLTNLKSGFSNAKRLESIARQLFNITLGIDYNANTNLKESLEDLAQTNIALNILAKDFDISNTIDFRIAENDVKSKNLQLKYEKSKALPSLSASLSGGFNTFSNSFTTFDFNNQWYDFAVLGVDLNIPIFSALGRSARSQRAKIELEKSKDQLTETEQILKLEIESAKSNYQFAAEEYYNKKENLDLATRIEQKNQTKYFEGIGTSFELSQAQSQLYGAQQDYLQAMLNVINTKAALETLTNTFN